MSERLKCTSQVSNEDIIEDLTKDLESSLNTVEPDQDVEKESCTSSEVRPTESGDAGKPTVPEGIPSTTNLNSEDLDRDDQGGSESDSDSIDEVALKDAEIELTDEQREERKRVAEELKEAGNNAFKNGDCKLSIEKYTEALNICPLKYDQLRAILYCNRSAARMKMEDYKHAIKDCTKSIELDDKYIKAYFRRAQSYEATEKFDESLADYKKILELDPSHKEANKATIRLPPLIEEKNEKLKTEMLGKLKDLGNMILKPFGLSTENFQMEQDPETKGYKINFKQ